MRMLRALILGTLLLAACSPATTTAPTAAPAAATPALRTVTLAMPFIPNVQFAPFYVAAQKGYYREAGIEVVFDYNFENDVVQRIANGTVDFALAGGVSVLLARVQGLPVVSVMTLNQQFPVVLFSKAGRGITAPDDLAGRTIGIPGRFGAGYHALLALLDSAGLSERDVTIAEIGFDQVPILMEDKVEVVTGYAMNEPVQLAARGIPVDVIRVADYFPLVSDTVIASEQTIAERADLVRGFVQASLRGMADAIADPQAAFDIAVEGYIPEIASGDMALQLQVLQGSVPFWQSSYTAQHGLGALDPEAWAQTSAFLRRVGLLTVDVDVSRALTNDFVK